MKKFLILFLFSPALSSCINFHFIDGWPELVSAGDTLMNDSCLVYGYARVVDNSYPVIMYFDVTLENSNLRITTDSTGYYSIKTLPGVCSVSCEMQGNKYDRLKETIRFLAVENKKFHVDFHIGYTVE